MRPILILAALLFSSTASGQTVMELNGGVSDYAGSGGGVTLYSPSGETHFTAGEVNGRFVYSASQRFMFRDWETYIGDYQLALTGGQIYEVAPVRGVALVKKRMNGELRIFSGAVGSVYSAPYFWGVEQSHLGGGFSYKQRVGHDWTFGTIQSVAGSVKTSLEEAHYHRSVLDVEGSAGWLQNNEQISGNASLMTRHFGGNVGRSTYIFQPMPGQTTSPASTELSQRTTVNTGSVFASGWLVNGSAAVFQSSTSSGVNLTAGTHAGPLQVQVSDFRSQSNYLGVEHHQSGQLLTVSEKISLHLNLSQYISRSNGAWNYSFGGGYTSNRFTANVGYNVLYFPLLPQPFQRVLSVSISTHIHGANFDIGTVALPNGKIQWSTGGTDYQMVHGLKVPSIPGATVADVRSLPNTGHGGKYILRGLVVDQAGKSVEGAAIIVGKDTVYTDSRGRFSIRERKRQRYQITVDLESFMSGERWKIESAPADAGVDETVNIILERV